MGDTCLDSSSFVPVSTVNSEVDEKCRVSQGDEENSTANCYRTCPELLYKVVLTIAKCDYV